MMPAGACACGALIRLAFGADFGQGGLSKELVCRAGMGVAW
jgi:hypothetical protein